MINNVVIVSGVQQSDSVTHSCVSKKLKKFFLYYCTKVSQYGLVFKGLEVIYMFLYIIMILYGTHMVFFSILFTYF